MSGFWVLSIGGAAIGMTLLFLDPVTDVTECPNYGGNGNASVFVNEEWDLLFPSLLLAWMLLITVEQLLPPTWRGRANGAVVARGVTALLIAVIASCCGGGRLLTLCH